MQFDKNEFIKTSRASFEVPTPMENIDYISPSSPSKRYLFDILYKDYAVIFSNEFVSDTMHRQAKSHGNRRHRRVLALSECTTNPATFINMRIMEPPSLSDAKKC